MKQYKLIILLSIHTLFVFGQTPETNGFQTPNFAPKTPEAAAFLKYGEYPIDLSSGVPNISIPIYTIDNKGFKLPISLDYHASGIKVNQEATWVGLGWSLNCGAQIILSVRDDIDENNPYIDQIPNTDSLKTYWTSHPYKYNEGPFTNNHLDKSRVKDFYSFSSPTANGNFYIKDFASNTVVIVPPDAFKVELLGSSRLNLGFRITDVSGNIYLFNNTKEVSVGTLTHGETYSSAWYVDEIKTPTNDKINFLYQDDGVINEYSLSQRIELTTIDKHIPCEYPADSKTTQMTPVINENSTTITTSKKIKEIIFNQGNSKVVFEKTNGRLDLSNGNGFLDKIEIRQLENSNFTYKKGFQFYYSYFNATDILNTPDYNKKRLKLDSIIDMLDGLTTASFVYSDLEMPSKTNTKDYFGYYNAAIGGLIPKHFITIPFFAEVGNANRDVNPAVNQTGILKEIHYPTKGWTKFNYESNQYYGIDPFDKYRLKTINSSVVQGTGLGTSAPNEGPGIDEIPICLAPNPINCVNYVKIPFQGINASGSLSYQMINSYGNGQEDPTITKYTYCRVRVFNNDVLIYDSNKMKSTQNYTSPLTFSGSGYILIEAYGSIMSIQGLQLRYVTNDPTPKNLFGGGLRIKNVENYDQNNLLVLKKEYDYNDINNSSISSGKLVNELTTSFISNPTIFEHYYNCPFLFYESNGLLCARITTKTFNIMSNSRYGIEGNSVVYKNVKERVVDPLNSGNNGYTLFEFTTDPDEIPFVDPTVQIYTSWKRGKIKEKSDFRSVGNSNYLLRKETNSYFEDNSRISFLSGFKMFGNYSTDAIEDSGNPLSNPFLCGLNMVNDVIELVTYNLSIPWFYQKNSVITDYFYDSNNSLNGSLTTTKTFNYDNPSHLQLSSQTNTNSKGETLTIKYIYPSDVPTEPNMTDLIIANRLVPPVSTEHYNGNTLLSKNKTVYGNDATTSNLLLPKNIYQAKFPNAFPVITYIGQLEKKISYDKYDSNGNVQQYTPENGTPVSIIWGYNQSQPIAKIENATYSEVQPYEANLQTLSNGTDETALITAQNTLRSNLPNAMITTYTYKPLIGVSTITDAKGDVIYYNYDTFGRLQNVKDKDGSILSENEYHFKN